jgi:hypothetical protein
VEIAAVNEPVRVPIGFLHEREKRGASDCVAVLPAFEGDRRGPSCCCGELIPEVRKVRKAEIPYGIIREGECDREERILCTLS